MTKYIDLFLKRCNEKSLDEKTLKAYRLDLEKYRMFSDDKMGKDVLISYINHLHEKYKVATVRRKVMSLKAFFKFLTETGIINDNPFYNIKTKFDFQPIKTKILNSVCITEILECAYKTLDCAETWFKSVSAHRDVAVLELLAGTGICVSELCDLKTRNVDLTAGIIKIEKGNRTRVLKIENSKIIDALKAYKKHFNEDIGSSVFFFINRLGIRLSEQSVRFMLKKYGNEAGYENITPLNFRRSFAVNMLNKNTDIRNIQRILGHSTVLITENFTEFDREREELIAVPISLKS